MRLDLRVAASPSAQFAGREASFACSGRRPRGQHQFGIAAPFDAPLGHRPQLCGLGLANTQPYPWPSRCAGSRDQRSARVMPGARRKGKITDTRRLFHLVPARRGASSASLPVSVKTCCARPSLDAPRPRRHSTNRGRVNRQQARETLASTLPVLTPSFEGALDLTEGWPVQHRARCQPGGGFLKRSPAHPIALDMAPLSSR